MYLRSLTIMSNKIPHIENIFLYEKYQKCLKLKFLTWTFCSCYAIVDMLGLIVHIFVILKYFVLIISTYHLCMLHLHRTFVLIMYKHPTL